MKNNTGFAASLFISIVSLYQPYLQEFSIGFFKLVLANTFRFKME